MDSKARTAMESQAERTVSEPGWQRGINWKLLHKIGLYLIMIAITLISIIPFLWMISTSLKPLGQVFIWPPVWIPDPLQWDNYVYIFETLPFLRYMFNTAFYAFAVTIGQLIACSMAAYAFARLEFPGRDTIFIAYLATMMIPSQVTIIPNYILMGWFDWVNTIWAMTIPGMFGSAFGTFLLRQYFLTIPREIDEAATIDGASKFRIYWQLILPIGRAGLAVLAVFTLMAVWNDFLWPFIMLHNDALKTLTLGLVAFQSLYTTEWNLLMAASVITILPLLVLFFFAQRFFVQAFTMSGLSAH